MNFYSAGRVLGAVLALSAQLGSSAVHAGEQADKAVAAVKEMIRNGEVKPGTVLRLRVKQGNLTSFLGRNNEMQQEWERLTGSVIDSIVMPQLDSMEFIRKSTDVDLTIARNHEYPDLFSDGLIEDLTSRVQRFGLRLSDDATTGYVLPKMQAYFGDRIVALPADGDVAMMYLRKDLIDDPANKTRFKEQFGKELRVPQTWGDYLELAQFFTQPKVGFYGALEPREPLTAWMYWLPRYASQARPNQYLFDDKMRPLLTSRAGIAATENFLATVKFSPPDILKEGNDYSYTLPFFNQGNGFATIITPAGGKMFSFDKSAVRGKFIAVPMPGTIVGGRLVRRSMFIYGNNLVIPSNSKNKDLAFLYAMWLTDPDVSAVSVKAKAIADPYRFSHFRDTQIADIYTSQVLETYRAELPFVTPSGTGLPGDSEYLKALSRNLWIASSGKMSAKEAMERTAREWEAITEKYGRAKQIEHFHAFKKTFPDTTEALR